MVVRGYVGVGLFLEEGAKYSRFTACLLHRSGGGLIDEARSQRTVGGSRVFTARPVSARGGGRLLGGSAASYDSAAFADSAHQM